MIAFANASRERVRTLSLADIKDNINTVADRFLAFWRGDSDAAKVSLFELGVQPELAHALCLAMDTVQRRRQWQLDFELNGHRIRRGRYRCA